MLVRENIPPVFPERALPSKAILYSPLQDIDIYVEDEGSEAFYTELLQRLVGQHSRIATVVPLRGRENVVKASLEYKESRPALFLIDGDLHWLTGSSLPSSPHLYIHPCYCVENYLFCEKAMIQIVIENSGTLKESDARERLAWSDLRSVLEEHLVPLFVEFAVAFKLCPEIKTVARGIGYLLQNAQRGSLPELDMDKVVAVQDAVKAEVLTRVDSEVYELARSAIMEQIRVLVDPLYSVSGKHFLMPIQMFAAIRVGGQKVQRKSFIFRLARHCDTGKFESLKRRLIEVLMPNKAIEVKA